MSILRSKDNVRKVVLSKALRKKQKGNAALLTLQGKANKSSNNKTCKAPDVLKKNVRSCPVVSDSSPPRGGDSHQVPQYAPTGKILL